MYTLKESGKSYRATLAMFAAGVTIFAASMMAMGIGKAASIESMPAASVASMSGLTLKEWQLLAK